MGLAVNRATGACGILCAVRVIRCRGKQWRHTYRYVQETDPERCERRRRRKLKGRVYTIPGLNYCWHIDGYDKIKPDGFAIQDCIDGYSRTIIWLRLDRKNNSIIP